MDNRKHVYILGAGFSRPLGGPLFTELLTHRLKYCSDNLTGVSPYDSPINDLYHRFTDGKRHIEAALYRDFNPEELLELIDLCADDVSCHEANKLLEGMHRKQPDEPQRSSFFKGLLKQLKRVIAAQCNAFIERKIVKERCDPYVRWMKTLDGDDTVITFNYDTAFEYFATKQFEDYPLEPGQYKNNMPHLLKLHGSADWYVDGRDVKRQECAYRERSLDVCLGMPGNGKGNLDGLKHFKTSWQVARQAIEKAAYVSIVGYSMPETDNNARMMILDSMAKGRDSIQRVNLVLGPDMGTTKAKRMLSILQPLLGGRKGRVTDVSMYTQDYLPRVADYLTYDF